MAQIPSTIASFLVSSIMSSTGDYSSMGHIVYGMVMDEKGNNVKGADILIESTVDKKRTISSGDGSFFSEICVCGSFDEVLIEASFGLMCGAEKISARGNHLAVDIILR